MSDQAEPKQNKNAEVIDFEAEAEDRAKRVVDSMRQASAIEGPIPPDERLLKILEDIEASGYRLDGDIYKLHAAMIDILATTSSSAPIKEHARVTLDFLAGGHDPQNLPPKKLERDVIYPMVRLSDSLGTAESLFNFMGAKPFTQSVYEEWLFHNAHETNERTSELWSKEKLKRQMIEGIDITRKFAVMGAEARGMSVDEMIEAMRREIAELLAKVAPEDTTSPHDIVNFYHRDAWGALARKRELEQNQQLVESA